MENLLFNLNSVAVSYGDNALTSIIQIEERVRDIGEFVGANSNNLSLYEKQEIRDRINKLLEVNADIRKELDKQAAKLKAIQDRLMQENRTA